MAERATTIRDVARAAGVSAMTVSRAINGQPGVRSETAQHIRDVVERMGYRPNKLAPTFRNRRRLSLIGMIVPDPHPALFTSVADEVSEIMRNDGFSVVTASSGSDNERERALVQSFIELGFDGILLFSEDTDHNYLDAELKSGRPIVFLGSPPVGVDGPAVLIDNRDGAHQAIEHLYHHGHRRIGIITSTTTFPASERLAGYREAMEALDLDVDPELIQARPITPAGGREAMESLLRLDDPPTAVFSTNYNLTAGVLGAIRTRTSAPALVAFDDFEAAALLDVPITVVTQDTRAQSEHATRKLREKIAGRSNDNERIIVPVHLTPRGSGEVPPTSDSPGEQQSRLRASGLPDA